MHFFFTWSILFLLLWEVPLIPPSHATPPPEFSHLSEGTIYWKSPHPPLATGLLNPRYWYTLWDEAHQSPYFLFTAKSCPSCPEPDKENQVLLFGASGQPIPFVHPGKVFDSDSPQLLLHSRFFYGQCLLKHPDGSPRADQRSFIVVFQEEKIDGRRPLQKSTLIAESGPGYLKERLWDRKLPPLNQTLGLVKKKVCFELPGKDRVRSSLKITDRKIFEQNHSKNSSLKPYE